jgi:PKHD-type hydroxylase|tara:strand:- start:348 stop:974 length:627 start_codon:yes stop_codon:yes gene_type:complete
MQLQNYFYWFKDAVPKHVCDDIVRYAKSIKDQMAVTGGYGDKKLNKKEVQDLKKKRDSDIVWLSERWIYGAVHPWIHEANRQANWNFEWSFSESCQFTKYKKGQYYDWHCDSWDRPYHKPEDPNSHGKQRKLSVTLSLSDEKDYKGGELEFDFRNRDPDKKATTHILKEIRSKGSLVVFPSDVWHRVKPVKSGVRHSLVIWNLGWPFK